MLKLKNTIEINIYAHLYPSLRWFDFFTVDCNQCDFICDFIFEGEQSSCTATL